MQVAIQMVPENIAMSAQSDQLHEAAHPGGIVYPGPGSFISNKSKNDWRMDFKFCGRIILTVC